MRNASGLIAASALTVCLSGTAVATPGNQTSSNALIAPPRAAVVPRPAPAPAAVEKAPDPKRGSRGEKIDLAAAVGQVLSAIAAIIAAWFTFRAASAARAAVVGLDRPFLIIRDVAKSRDGFGESMLSGPIYSIASIGRTPAVLESISEILRSEPPAEELAAVADPVDREELRDVILAGEQGSLQRKSAKTIESRRSVASWDIFLRYKDLIGGRYEVRFRYEWDGANWKPVAASSSDQPAKRRFAWGGGRGK
jgi:hypothetical protein